MSPTTRKRVVRFGLVGILNTLTDVLIFTILRVGGAGLIVANTFSTSVAIILSLILNSRYTFDKRLINKKRIALYIGVTLFGLWVLQPLVIYGAISLHEHFNYTAILNRLYANEAAWFAVIPKGIATVVTLAWNYLWYNYVVFAPSKNLLDGTETKDAK